MGFGLPGSIGAYYGDKNKKSICITGDGGIMFNLQELQTFISYKIPVKIFIINNGGYLTMKLMQDKNFKKFVGADKGSGLKLPNFLKLSKSLGYKIYLINSEKNTEKKLKKILDLKEPVVCEVMMSPMQQLIPRVQTQMNKDGTFEPATLDNMYPFFSKERLVKIRKQLLSIN
jgi:acetolactate synthase-1/2/3 large subunit